MNIREAKIEIANTLRAYLQKDAFGDYILSPVHQRPILLMGPPGIGKTAIMEQIAGESDVALVSYTMTHHTRQSAVGLPRIVSRTYDGREFTATEYTLSEIIASVYETMERTGKRESILFLDEINCVSETLSPTMLQFLQCKTFGNHALPEGWLIVAAGNPPEFNKSVREFDIVTLDRLRQLDVTADVDCFLSYASAREVHGAILSYLRLKPDRFYHVKRTEDTLQYVTARGWEDLSRLLLRYEDLEIPVSEELMGEFLRDEDICRDFCRYYRLYRKYGEDYSVIDILSGALPQDSYEKKCAMARSGDFAERFTVVQLVLAGIFQPVHAYSLCDRLTVALRDALRTYFSSEEPFSLYIHRRRESVKMKKQLELLSPGQRRFEQQLLLRLDEMNTAAMEEHLCQGEALREFLRAQYELDRVSRKDMADGLQSVLSRAFRFIADSFGAGQELTQLLLGLSSQEEVMEYIALYGCEEYIRYSERLMTQQAEEKLRADCAKAIL